MFLRQRAGRKKSDLTIFHSGKASGKSSQKNESIDETNVLASLLFNPFIFSFVDNPSATLKACPWDRVVYPIFSSRNWHVIQKCPIGTSHLIG